MVVCGVVVKILGVFCLCFQGNKPDFHNSMGTTQAKVSSCFFRKNALICIRDCSV